MSQDEQRRFSQLYRQHFSFVWRTLRHFGVAPAHLEDGAHEVFIVYFKKFMDQASDAKPSTVLYGIARRIAANHRRGTQRREKREQHDQGPSAQASPEEVVMQKEAKDLVETFMTTLSTEQAEAFWLTQIEGLPAAEVANMLNLNLNTLNSRIRTAKQHFQTFVKRSQSPPLPQLQGTCVQAQPSR